MHTHTHIHTHAHRNRKTHTHKQSTPTCTCGHRLTLMPDMVQSVSPSVWRCLYSAKTTLPQTHSCTHTDTHMHARTQRHTHSPPTHTHIVILPNSNFKVLLLLLSALFASPLLSSPPILYTFPRLVGMVTLMGWPLLGDAESGQKEHRHGEKKAIPGWAASTDALLQLGNNRIKFSLKNKREWETIRTQQQQERDRS